jgi:two-component system osmolarity sensor histidine kinase EnvZ
VYLLEAALAQRVGTHQHLLRDTAAQGETHYWATLPSGGQTHAVGLAADRMASQPVLALAGILLLGLVVSVALAWLLTRRVVAPLAKLGQAAAQMGLGQQPERLPETGPSELVALSRSFNHMAAQVQELMAARTALLAGVSHDLRTPLARMRLALEMLKSNPSPSLMDRLDRDVQHMNQIIGNVLDLARGVAHEAATPVNVTALLTDLAQAHSTAACQISLKMGSEAGGIHLLPEVSVRRALNNLLENAMRYAPSCPVELVCEIGPNSLKLGVLDRGPGIPAHLVEHMFQPFQRVDTSRNPATGGTGLGLAIVRALAQAHGWQVSLQPREGGGMSAWLDMPLPDADMPPV